MKRATALLFLLAAACGGGKTTTKSTTALRGTITVDAASSLTEAFTELGGRFQTDHPEAKVTFNFGASSGLAEQLIQGATADVVATADETTMNKVVGAQLVTSPAPFAANKGELIVAKGNPKGIHGLADLDQPGVTFVMCAVEVPCGKLATQVLVNAKVKADPKSFEENVKAVVSKVALGEVDAGIAYVSDVAAAGEKIEGVPIAAADNVTATYPISVVKASRNKAVAQAFVDLVLSARGQAVLRHHGFLPRPS